MPEGDTIESGETSKEVLRDPHEVIVENAKAKGLHAVVEALQKPTAVITSAKPETSDKTTTVVKELRKIEGWITKDRRGESQPAYDYEANRNGRMTSEVLSQLLDSLGVDTGTVVRRAEVFGGDKYELADMGDSPKLFRTNLGYILERSEHLAQQIEHSEGGIPHSVRVKLLRPIKGPTPK